MRRSDISVCDTPKFGLSCNCSVCRRLGTIWVYSDRSNVQIEGATIEYAWGDKNISFHSCSTCGCTSHWADLKNPVDGKIAVNINLCPPEQIAEIPVRRFDGAETWTFLDD